nr:putative spermatogenesis-associated protein 31D3 isoform X2 [Microcebus murinus]
MENILCFPSCHIEPWLSFGSTVLDTDPQFVFLGGLGLLFLYLFYLVMKSFFSTTLENEDITKDRAKRRRNGGTLKGQRTHQCKAEEERKLFSILISPWVDNHDTMSFRQLLCPDPLCDVCNSTTAEIMKVLLRQSLEDAAPSVSLLGYPVSVTESSHTFSSTLSVSPPGELIPAPLPEPSPPPASFLSPDLMTPLPDLPSPSPPDDPLPPEPISPSNSKPLVDPSSPQPLAFPPLPPHHTQGADPVLQPEATLSVKTIFAFDPILSQDISPLQNSSLAIDPTDTHACHHAPPTPSASPLPDGTLTVTQSKSTSSVSKPVLEVSSPASTDELSTYVPTIRGIDPSSFAILEFSWWQPHAQDLFPSNLAPCDFKQELSALHSSEASFVGDSAAILIEPGKLSFFNPDILALLERQVKKRSDFLMWKEKGKKMGSFPKQLKSDYRLNSSAQLLVSTADKHGSAVSLPLWTSTDKPEELHAHPQHIYSKTFEDNLKQKYIQLFCGLPSLHSESLQSTVLILGGSSSTFVLFNGISNASVAQESPVLPLPQPLSLPEAQSQLLPQILPPSQPLALTQVQSQAQLQSPFPILSSDSLSQIRICGVCFHKPQKEAQSLMPSEIHHLEWNVLQKEQEIMWGLPSVVKKSQKDFCPPSPNLTLVSHSFKAHVPISILPGDFPLSSELRKKLEHHLRKRLIQHRWGLPRRIYESLSLLNPQRKIPETSESKCHYGLSWISFFKSQGSKDLENSGLSQSGSLHERCSEMLSLKKNVRKDQGHSLENGPKDHLLNNPERSSDKGLGSHSVKDVEHHMVSLPGNNSRASSMSLGPEQLENALTAHLSKKFEKISESQISRTMHNSCHSIKQTVPLPKKSHSQIKHRNLVSLVGGNHNLNTSQEVFSVGSSQQELLEDHIKSYYMRMIWGLPPKVLESMEIFNSKKDSSESLPNFASSTYLISGVDSKDGVSRPLRRSSKAFHEEQVRTTNSVPILDHVFPVPSPVGKGGQGTLRQSPSDTNHELTENLQTIEDGKQTFLAPPHSSINKASQKPSILTNRYRPKLPTRQAGAGHKPVDVKMSSNDGAARLQGKRIKNLEHFPKLNRSREIFKAQELYALQ